MSATPADREVLGDETVQTLAAQLVDETDEDAARELENMLVDETRKD